MLFKAVKDSATASNSSSDSLPSVVDGENGTENIDEAIKKISKKGRILQKYRVETAQDDAIRSEICTYLQMGVSDEELDNDSLVFWKTANFVYLKSIAKVVLTKSASSIPVHVLHNRTRT